MARPGRRGPVGPARRTWLPGRGHAAPTPRECRRPGYQADHHRPNRVHRPDGGRDILTTRRETRPFRASRERWRLVAIVTPPPAESTPTGGGYRETSRHPTASGERRGISPPWDLHPQPARGCAADWGVAAWSARGAPKSRRPPGGFAAKPRACALSRPVKDDKGTRSHFNISNPTFDKLKDDKEDKNDTVVLVVLVALQTGHSSATRGEMVLARAVSPQSHPALWDTTPPG
jgi:hypothetical protein